MLRTKDFKVYYTDKILETPSDFELEISKIAINLLKEIYKPEILYRAVGVVLSKIGEQGTLQLSLYTDSEEEDKKKKLSECVDRLEKRFSKNIVKIGYSDRKNIESRE